MSTDEWAGVRVYMKDRLKFLRDAAGVAAATDAMGKSTGRYADSADRASKKGFLFNQALFTMRRMAYGATLAVTGMVVGATALGIKFDIMRQNAQFAFTTLLGDSQSASKEVEYLFQLAAKTPFDFQNVQQFARQFLGWGFSLKQTNRYLSDFSDVIAAMGGDVSVMDRVSLAFGQIRSSGVLLGQDLRQLQQAIPGVSQMLQKQLGLTAVQMRRGIGALRIPANTAIEAIMRGIENDPRFKGAAAALQQSAQGQLTTLHDYASRLFGDLVAAPFDALVKALPHINDDINELSQILENQGFTAFASRLDQMTGSGGNLVRVINLVTLYATALWHIFQNSLIPSLGDAATVVLPILYVALLGIGSVLQFVSHHTTALRIVLDILIGRFLILKGIEIATWLIAVGGAARVATVRFFAMSVAEKVAMFSGFRLVAGLQFLWFWMEYGATITLPALTTAVWGFTAALLANPITWIIIGIIALIAILVILYFKWQWFHNLVDETYHFIVNNWPYVAVALGVMLGPLGIAISLASILIAHYKDVVRWAQEAWGWAKKIGGFVTAPGDWVSQNIFGNDPKAWNKALAAANAAHQASGGMVTGAGWSWVGEQGPELHFMNRGAVTVPLEKVPMVQADEADLEALVPVILKLDSRVIAEANARVKLKKRARQ